MRTERLLSAGLRGTTNVIVTGISGLGSSVTAQVESTSTPNRFTAVSAPTLVEQQTLPVSGGQVTVQISSMSASRAYQVLLRPADGSGTKQLYYAANASIHNATIGASAAAPDGYYVGGLTHSGDARDDSFVDFVVDVPTARSYTMTVDYANPGTSTGTLGLAHDGGAWQTLAFPPTGSGWATTSTTVSLTAGYNVIRLAMGSPFFTSGSGTINLGYLQLS